MGLQVPIFTFFNNFSEIFADSCILDMPTNYRSARTIVDVGNALMKNRGVPGKAHKTITGRAVIADLSAFSPTPQEKTQTSETTLRMLYCASRTRPSTMGRMLSYSAEQIMRLGM